MLKLIVKDDFVASGKKGDIHFEHDEVYTINRIQRISPNEGYELDLFVQKYGCDVTVELWLIEDWKDLFEIVVE